jgi:hypothetical protein
MPMQTRAYNPAIIDAARQYVTLGLPIIPLVGKIPAIKAWQQFVANVMEAEVWFGPVRCCNIGLRTGESGYIVVDTDTVVDRGEEGSHFHGVK